MRPSSILALALLLPLLSSPALGAPADDPRPVVPASEILAKIERGEPVEYDGVIVEGDLDLSGLDLPTRHVERTQFEIEVFGLTEEAKIVESPISITNSEIRGDVDFSSVILLKQVIFGELPVLDEQPLEEPLLNEPPIEKQTILLFPLGDSQTQLSGDADFSWTQFSSDSGFSRAQFSGDADFYRAQFSGDAGFYEAQFSGDASFYEAQFSSDSYFQEALFSGDSYFQEALFSGDSYFQEAKFSGDSYFYEAQFSGDSYFQEALFSGDADFSWTQFSGDADFSKAQFSSDVGFYEAQFSGDVGFYGAQFSGYSGFYEAQFSGDAGFYGSQFSGDANFYEAQFSSGAGFYEAQFSGDTGFYRAQFSGDADFSKAQFNGDVDFSKAQFSGEVDLRGSCFDHANLTFEDARDIYILQLSDTTFKNEFTICLNGTAFERLYVNWNQLEGALIYNGEVYLTLVKNFKNIEYFEDADDCYYHYRREKQSIRSWREVAKYTDILGWVTCGYGVRPGYTLLLGLFVVSMSAVYYWRRDAIRRLKGDKDESAKFSDAFYFSMMTFTTVGYGDWYPLDRHRNVVMIEGIVGWLTLSLFLVTLANVIIR